jgi:peptidoglycan/xylan/chitin deacetylase (PgdA/CDA1 family)
MVALTYDDGPTAAILDVLEARGARATFFVFGAKAAERPELIARMNAAGHEVNPHTWTLDTIDWDTTRSADLILDEIGGRIETDSVILMHDVPEGPLLTAGLLDRIACRGWHAGLLPA